MNAVGIVRMAAGSFALLLSALDMKISSLFASKCVRLYSAIFGLNLLRNGYSQICPLNNIFASFGVKSSC